MPLAFKLGETPHVSALLKKVHRLGDWPEAALGQWLLKCAVERGASHYERDFQIQLPSDNLNLSDEEIGVALCLGELPYEAVHVRAAAQLLSSDQINQARLMRLAIMERVEPVLLYIAAVAAKYAPEQQPWVYLRQHLSARRSVPTGVFPHWSRFVSQTGVTPFGGGPRIDWLSRRELVR